MENCPQRENKTRKFAYAGPNEGYVVENLGTAEKRFVYTTNPSINVDILFKEYCFMATHCDPSAVIQYIVWRYGIPTRFLNVNKLSSFLGVLEYDVMDNILYLLNLMRKTSTLHCVTYSLVTNEDFLLDDLEKFDNQPSGFLFSHLSKIEQQERIFGLRYSQERVRTWIERKNYYSHMASSGILSIKTKEFFEDTKKHFDNGNMGDSLLGYIFGEKLLVARNKATLKSVNIESNNITKILNPELVQVCEALRSDFAVLGTKDEPYEDQEQFNQKLIEKFSKKKAKSVVSKQVRAVTHFKRMSTFTEGKKLHQVDEYTLFSMEYDPCLTRSIIFNPLVPELHTLKPSFLKGLDSPELGAFISKQLEEKDSVIGKYLESVKGTCRYYIGKEALALPIKTWQKVIEAYHQTENPEDYGISNLPMRPIPFTEEIAAHRIRKAVEVSKKYTEEEYLSVILQAAQVLCSGLLRVKHQTSSGRRFPLFHMPAQSKDISYPGTKRFRYISWPQVQASLDTKCDGFFGSFHARGLALVAKHWDFSIPEAEKLMKKIDVKAFNLTSRISNHVQGSESTVISASLYKGKDKDYYWFTPQVSDEHKSYSTFLKRLRKNLKCYPSNQAYKSGALLLSEYVPTKKESQSLSERKKEVTILKESIKKIASEIKEKDVIKRELYTEYKLSNGSKKLALEKEIFLLKTNIEMLQEEARNKKELTLNARTRRDSGTIETNRGNRMVAFKDTLHQTILGSVYTRLDQSPNKAVCVPDGIGTRVNLGNTLPEFNDAFFKLLNKKIGKELEGEHKYIEGGELTEEEHLNTVVNKLLDTYIHKILASVAVRFRVSTSFSKIYEAIFSDTSSDDSLLLVAASKITGGEYNKLMSKVAAKDTGPIERVMHEVTELLEGFSRDPGNDITAWDEIADFTSKLSGDLDLMESDKNNYYIHTGYFAKFGRDISSQDLRKVGLTREKYIQKYNMWEKKLGSRRKRGE